MSPAISGTLSAPTLDASGASTSTFIDSNGDVVSSVLSGIDGSIIASIYDPSNGALVGINVASTNGQSLVDTSLTGTGGAITSVTEQGGTVSVQASGANVVIGADATASVNGGDNHIDLSAGDSLNASGNNDNVSVGQNSTAVVNGSGANIQLSGNDTVNANNATIQDSGYSGTDTVVGSGNNIGTTAGLTVNGDSNTVYDYNDGLATNINGNGNTYSGQDSESIGVIGSNNNITAGELPTIDVAAGTDNTIQSLGSNVTLGAGASIQVSGEDATVQSTSYGTDEAGDLITTTNIYDQQGSDTTPISITTTVTNPDGDIISESNTSSVDDGGDYYTVNSTITSSDDGSQELTNTYTDDQGNTTAILDIGTDIFGNRTSASLTEYQTDNQNAFVETASYSDGVETGWTEKDYDDSNNLIADTTGTYDNGQEDATTTRYDDGVKTEVDTYTDGTISQADLYDNGAVTESDTYTDGRISEADLYDNGVKTEVDTYTDGTISQADLYDNGAVTETDTYTDGTISQADLYDNGVETEKDIYTDGTISEVVPYVDGVPGTPWTPSDGEDPPDDGGVPTGDPGDNNGAPSGGEPPDDEVPDPPELSIPDPGIDEFGLLGFAGSQSVITDELNSDTGSIAAQRLNSGDYAGAAAAQNGFQQAREMASVTPTSGTGNVAGIGTKWAGNVITWSLSGDVGSQYEAEAQQAFATWAAASGLTFDEVSGSAAADIRISFGNLDSATTGVVGYTTLQSAGGITAAASIELEDPGQDALVTGAGGQLTYSGTDATLEQVMLHEIGHALGLADDSDQDSIMYYELTSSNSTLDSTDIAGIRALLYGAPGTSISGFPASVLSSGQSTAAQNAPANDRLNHLIAGMASFDPQGAASTHLTHGEHVHHHDMLAASAA